MNKQFLKEVPFIISIFIVVLVVGWDIQRGKNLHVQAKEVEEVTPIPTPTLESITVSETPSPTPHILKETTFESYVVYKFGEYANKAFLLLEGDGVCGGENKSHDPNALNINANGSRDRGYWQINDRYHPHVSDWCASDIKCSTDYAWRMFKNDNHTFRRWTAGRCIGI